MKYVTVAMIAEHVCRQPAAVRRALRIAGVELTRLPGVQGVRIAEKDANDFILKHWPECGPISARLQSVPASRHVYLEDKVIALERVVDALRNNDTGYVIALERMKAQNEALRSMLNEVLRETGMSRDVCDRHFITRSNYFLDQLLSSAESASPQLAAMLDDRDPEEIPTEKGVPPLFPKSH